MADLSEVAPMLDIPLAVEATIAGPTLTAREALRLRVGSVGQTAWPAAEIIQLVTGGSYIGAGELGEADGRMVVRMVRFKNPI